MHHVDENYPNPTQYQFALENLGAFYWEYDLKSNRLFIDPKLAKVLGLESNAYLDRKKLDALLHYDDRDSNQNLFKRLVAGEIENYTHEFRIQTAKGEYVWLQEQGARYQEQSSKIIGTHIQMDQSTTQIAKSRLEPLLEYGNYFLWETDYLGHYTFVNPHVETLIGYPSEEIIGKRLFDLMPKIEVKRLFSFYKEIFRHKKSFVELMNVKLNRNGESIYFLSSASPFFDRDGKFAGYRGVDWNITQEIRLEQELTKQKIMLTQREEELTLAHTSLVQKAQKEAFKTKAKFLANMSQNIHQPMSEIIKIAHATLEGELHPKKREPLQKIEMQARTLLEIIQDILDMSKIEVGELHIVHQDFDLLQTIDEMMRFLDQQAQAKGLIIDIAYGREVKRHYKGDASRIAQVLTNLIFNAIEYTQHGTIELFIDRLDNQTMHFEVRDSDIGMSQEQQDRLFKSFEEINSLTTLGLVLSQQLVAMMGGKIWCESNLGEGSTFIFEVPLQENQQEQLIEKESHYDEILNDLKNALYTLDGSHILLADDTLANQEEIKELLKQSDIVIDLASNGKEAIEMYQARPTRYDLILMSLQLPFLNGLEATKQIRASGAQISIIALVENEQQSEIIQSQTIGMNDVIQKPIHAIQLYKTLLKYIFSKTTSTKKTLKEKKEINFPTFESIDVALGLSYCENNPNLFTEILHNFRAEYYGIYLDILDESELQNTIHTLKHHAKSIGAMKLFHLTQSYEANFDPSLLSKLYRELHTIIEEIEEKLVE